MIMDSESMDEYKNGDRLEENCQSSAPGSGPDDLWSVLEHRQAELEAQVGQRISHIVRAARQAGIDPTPVLTYKRRMGWPNFDDDDLYDAALSVLEEVAILDPDNDIVELWYHWILESRRYYTLLFGRLSDEPIASAMADKEEWLPAAQAVEMLQSKGVKITLSDISKHKEELLTRPRTLLGRHKYEIEINALAAWAVLRVKPNVSAEPKTKEEEDPDVVARMAKAKAAKSKGRPLDRLFG
jgi:hypothetical protein